MTERPMRNLLEVIDQMLEVIPETEEDLIISLKSNRRSAEFTSPETMSLRWDVTCETLKNELPVVDSIDDFNEWQKKVYNIWMDTSDETSSQMEPNDIVKLIEGKKIKEIKHSTYLGWMVIDEIHLEDGTVLELSGNADCAKLDWLGMPDDKTISPYIESEIIE